MNQMSVEGIRISHVPSKGRELSSYMSQILDDEWKKNRGMEIQSVGIASISYDDESKELINMRNKGAMLGDPSVREGYVQGSVARGLEAAGSNEGGAMGAFLGMGVGMQGAGSFIGAASQSNKKQMEDQAQKNEQAQPKKANEWFCTECGAKNSGKFCSECGSKGPEKKACTNCGYIPEGATPKFCPECGNKF
jgi:membrane protease subunit (stomatin/prohibitin family)